ncbi:hypothetical protein CONLIGDRAFT_100700 [Coniochaeta ligniaria NRRL 30616]|uniref:Uncharacterized protein n=1 Tax=Coniochaeta ligniaria NRRL 30616 TaxID=1408157 RepID=A0A1J7JAM9_9PEZI|nr:hypothetical protein CONLIGDRAFT_100700 [Coniochaeta ligniaria NRRL 30616]
MRPMGRDCQLLFSSVFALTIYASWRACGDFSFVVFLFRGAGASRFARVLCGRSYVHLAFTFYFLHSPIIVISSFSSQTCRVVHHSIHKVVLSVLRAAAVSSNRSFHHHDFHHYLAGSLLPSE